MGAFAQRALFELPADGASTLAPEVSVPAPTEAPRLSPRRAQAWIGLHFADLALAAALGAMNVEERVQRLSVPWAIMEADRFKRVIACNALAWQRGIRPGHRMNAAIALCAELLLVPRDNAAEVAFLKCIASECLRYTATVSVQAPNELLLEVRGSFRLFGGPQALLERIEADLRRHEAGLKVALAPTARSAQWLARDAKSPRLCLPRALPSALSSLPLSSLHWPLALELQLVRFGVTTVGDLLRLSRKDLGRRIGGAAVAELQQALGRAPWLHPRWSTEPTYHDRLVLDFDVETTELLEKLLSRPLARLRRTLVTGALAIDTLALTLKHRECDTQVMVRLQAPTADTKHLASLLHEHLDRLVLPAPVREVLLTVPRLRLARPQTRALGIDPTDRTEASADPEAAQRLLEQLQSRFGVARVRALALNAHHLPERAQHASPPTGVEPPRVRPPPLAARPLWLLATPRPIDAEYRHGAFLLESSPETIEVEAWEGPAVRRAYYRARTRQGHRWWVFRDLTPPYPWYLHGLYG